MKIWPWNITRTAEVAPDPEPTAPEPTTNKCEEDLAAASNAIAGRDAIRRVIKDGHGFALEYRSKRVPHFPGSVSLSEGEVRAILRMRERKAQEVIDRYCIGDTE